MNDIVPTTPVHDIWVAFMERAMTDDRFDTAKLAALMEARHKEMEQQRIERAEQRRQIFNAAMSAFQGEVDPILKDAINPFLKNKYATLMKSVEVARPVLLRHGLNVRYLTEQASQPNALRLGIIVGHDCGYEDPPLFVECPIGSVGSQGGRMAMTPPQALGATISYLRRQLFALSLNLVSAEVEDLDGEEARPLPRAPAAKATTPHKPTVGQWLADFEAAVDGCEGADELTELLDKPDTRRMRGFVRNGAAAHLEAIISAATTRLMPVPDWHEPPEGEPVA